MTISSIPVITIDGPTASGKGTVARMVAEQLGFHYLDSGSLYRLTALSAFENGVQTEREDEIARLAATLDCRFEGDRVFLDGQDVTQDIRAEDIGNTASRIAVLAPVREALLQLQKGFRKAPGLVADGRDMGTVVFPDAQLKVFLTASAEARAKRRYNQLIEKGFSANMDSLIKDLAERDARDTSRATSPLKQAEDAYLLDNSTLTAEQTVAQIARWYAAL